MLGRTQNVTVPTSLALRKLQPNEKEKKTPPIHREALVIIKYVEDRFSERSKKKRKRKSNTTKEISAGYHSGKVCNEARHNPKIFITI
jgi:hypothetical protein